MMLGRKQRWFSEGKRRKPLQDNHESRAKTACFGYQRVPENEKIKLVIRHFNTVAGKYDMMNTLLSFGIHHQWRRNAIRILGLKEGEVVLDLCGGTGDLSILAARAVGLSGRVILYDINRAMMDIGKSKVANSSYGNNVLYVQGDAEEISLQDQLFDAAFVGFGIRNLTHMEKGFKEMYRLLKPGGKLMCLDLSKPTASFFRWLYDFYSFYIMPLLGGIITGSRRAYTYLPESIRVFPLPDELTAILKKVGFSHITYRKLTNGMAVVHLAKKKSMRRDNETELGRTLRCKQPPACHAATD